MILYISTCKISEKPLAEIKPRVMKGKWLSSGCIQLSQLIVFSKNSKWL